MLFVREKNVFVLGLLHINKLLQIRPIACQYHYLLSDFLVFYVLRFLK